MHFRHTGEFLKREKVIGNCIKTRVDASQHIQDEIASVRIIAAKKIEKLELAADDHMGLGQLTHQLAGPSKPSSRLWFPGPA